MDDGLMYRREFYIGGRWTSPAGSETFQVISPSTEMVVGEVPLATSRDIDRAVDSARAAFDSGPWPRMRPEERAELLGRTAELLRKYEAEIAGVITDEIPHRVRRPAGGLSADYDTLNGGSCWRRRAGSYRSRHRPDRSARSQLRAPQARTRGPRRGSRPHS